MVVEVGAAALVVALVVAAFTVVASLAGSWSRSPELVESGRYALYTVPLLLLVATATLVYAFVTRDFQVKYVAENSSRAMPYIYTWVAFYAGNAGSMLYLSLALALMSVIGVRTMSRRLPRTAPAATGLLGLTLAFFLGVMVFMANPLERLPVAPPDGQGINPLLVHMGMFFHPPMQMAGLVSVALPFSIAVGALLAGRGGGEQWIDIARRWGLISWLLLTVGLILGAWWAYTILGWGGYWAWDPVENVALMPWLAMTAFVHTIMVQRRRGMFRLWNMVLIIVAFALAQLGMFLNRGGPVPSVHSFAESTMGWAFLVFMAATLVASIALLVWRAGTVRGREGVESLVSRESAFLLNNVLLLAVAFVTLWGTIYPLFSEVSQGQTVTVGAPFYNRVNGPLLLVLVLLMGIGPLLPWRRASGRQLRRMVRTPAVAAGVVAAGVVVLGVRQPVAVLSLAVCALVATGIIQEWTRGTRARHRHGESYPGAFLRLVAGNRPRYGGYIVHLGIILLAVGAIASSFYSVQKDYAMSPGETRSLGAYSFEYTDVQRTRYPDRMEVEASFRVSRGESDLGTMTPTRTFYPSFNMGATRAAIRSTPLEDFYMVPSQFDEAGSGVFRVYIFPLVWWMWASGPVMLLGTLVSLWPQRRPAPARTPRPAPGRPAAPVGTAGGQG